MESWPQDYDPSLEWPRADVDSECETHSRPPPATPQNHTCFRLVVKSSEVLARKRRVAILDAYEEVQIGRDASNSDDIPRIRLKDMEVSKVHATLFWDREISGWAIVDMGSKHGTFMKAGLSDAAFIASKCDASGSDSDGVVPKSSFTRLSPERQASRPRPLYHLDELSIGRTTFIIHVHMAGLPCDECRSEGQLDIPLFSVSKGSMHPQKSVGIAEDKAKVSPDARTAMSLLRRSLLTRHSSAPLMNADGASQQYIDRSAKRRALHPYSRSNFPPPGLAVNRPLKSASYKSSSPPTGKSTIPVAPFALSLDAGVGNSFSHSSMVSSSPTPISDANVGRRLLEKQGWIPGSTLGVPTARFPGTSDKEDVREINERMALLEPIQISANIGRRGLGMRSDLASTR